jgi:hypothetical protein
VAQARIHPPTAAGFEPASAAATNDAGNTRRAQSPGPQAAIQCNDAARLISVLKQCGKHRRSAGASQLRNLAGENRNVRLQTLALRCCGTYKSSTHRISLVRRSPARPSVCASRKICRKDYGPLRIVRFPYAYRVSGFIRRAPARLMFCAFRMHACRSLRDSRGASDPVRESRRSRPTRRALGFASAVPRHTGGGAVPLRRL